MACNFIKKRLWHRYFPVNFAKFLRTSLFTEHLRWLLLKGLFLLLCFFVFLKSYKKKKYIFNEKVETWWIYLLFPQVLPCIYKGFSEASDSFQWRAIICRFMSGYKEPLQKLQNPRLHEKEGRKSESSLQQSWMTILGYFTEKLS